MNYQQNPNDNPAVNFKSMSNEDITKLRNSCDKELNRRYRVEQRKAKADIQKKAEKYGLSVTVETKES